MSAKSIAQLCAAKLQHFFELCKNKYGKSSYIPSEKHQSGNGMVMRKQRRTHKH